MTTDRRRDRLGDLPWVAPATGSEARSPLTRDEIVAAGIALLDRDGADALSMRRLGQELGAGATSLYWHVKNKDQLLDLILDSVIGEVMDEIAPAEGWQDRLAELARAVRRVVVRHRHVAPLLGERPTLGPKALDAAEYTMAILRDAGFDDRTTSLASGALINYAAGFAMFESKNPGGAESPEAKAQAEAIMAYFRGLPPDRYPNMLAIAGEHITDDDQFEYGLERLLDGFASDLAAGPRPSRPPKDGDADGNAILLR